MVSHYHAADGVAAADKGLAGGTARDRAEVSKRLESLKHLLWHGNTEEALERLGDLLMELSLIEARSNAAKKVVDGLDDFRTYICNNREFIPNFGERRRQGETISTAFVESTINQVVSRRFVKKQLAAFNAQIHVFKCADTGEGFGDSLHGEERRCRHKCFGLSSDPRPTTTAFWPPSAQTSIQARCGRKRSRTTRQLRSLKKSGRCRHVTKEVLEIHVLLTRSLFGDGTPRRLLGAFL